MVRVEVLLIELGLFELGFEVCPETYRALPRLTEGEELI